MLGAEILLLSLRSCTGARPGEADALAGFGVDRNEVARRGATSGSGCTEPMPSDARSAERSKGDDENSVVLGDMIPKASAASTSLDGCKGVIANSADRGDESASVGVVDSASLAFDLSCAHEASGCTTCKTGTR